MVHQLQASQGDAGALARERGAALTGGVRADRGSTAMGNFTGSTFQNVQNVRNFFD